MTSVVFTPWSDEQVEILNAYQNNSRLHEHTCLNDHGDLSRTLIATNNGWICPNCDYTQDWAHSFVFKRNEPT